MFPESLLAPIEINVQFFIWPAINSSNFNYYLSYLLAQNIFALG
ncbi:WIF domain [Nostoc flagelliforme CCNUN1]|uniref:WIF domain n=1 Tax=Nostoc flagelliforme CCNUN1 TaxID=2038116 RepID=A0A2K8SIC8_9NOSO|nr:WIF domain [Nostoc flagelliforme CCNUN1]